jgi:SAM-dependent methyltransferase
VDRIAWPEGAEVLEVGCGSGALWVNVAPLLPHLRLTLTDFSPGMVDAATAAVAPLPGIELCEARTCDVQDLPFDDGTFDLVVANHMLYHVPDLSQAVAEFARVLRPDGVLMAATNGPRHLSELAAISREALGWSPLDFVDRRFGRTNGAAILGAAFGSVEWHLHPSALVCTDPDDVYAFIASTAPGQEASPEQQDKLRLAIDERFRAGGGSLEVTMESGCFVARDPSATNPDAPIGSRSDALTDR